jgi:hypothetical protein
VVADGESGDVRADRVDDPGRFVAEDDGRGRGEDAVDDAEIGMTDAAVPDADSDVPGRRVGDGHVVADD